MNQLPTIRPLATVFTVVALSAAVWGCDKVEPTEPPKTSPDALRNMAPRADASAALPVEEGADKEPNDVIEQATTMTWSPDGAAAEGVLTAGRNDTDIYRIAPSSSLSMVAVTVTPGEDGDVIVGLVPNTSVAPVWFDSRPGGAAETIPNVGVGDEGVYIVVAGRGEGDVSYRLDVRPAGDGGIESEPNDNELLAQTLSVGTSLTAFSNRAGDIDHYRVVGTGAVAIDVSPLADGTPTQVSLRIEGGEAQAWSATTGDVGARFGPLLLGTDGYELIVETLGESANASMYTVSVSAIDASGAIELEPNDSPANAQKLEATTTTLPGQIQHAADVDRFVVSYPAGATEAPRILTVQAIPVEDGPLDLSLELVLVEGGLNLTRSIVGAGSPEAVCNQAISGSNTVEIAVSAVAGEAAPLGPLPYELKLETRAGDREEREPNEEIRRASGLGPSRRLNGYIHPLGDIDHYRFEIPAIPLEPLAKARVNVGAGEGYGANLGLSLLDASGVEVTRSDRSGYGERESFAVDLPPGVYFVRVGAGADGSDCARPYELVVEIDAGYLTRANGTGLAVPPVEPPTPDPLGDGGTDAEGVDGTDPEGLPPTQLDPSPGSPPSSPPTRPPPADAPESDDSF